MERNIIHINLAATLMIAQFVFLIGIDQTRNKVLHYTFFIGFVVALHPPFSSYIHNTHVVMVIVLIRFQK